MKKRIRVKRYQTGGNLNYLNPDPQFTNQIQPLLQQQQQSGQFSSRPGQFNQYMNKTSKLGGAIGTGYYASQQPNSLASAQGEQGYNTTMGAVSQAGPIGGVIGGVSAFGDAIGKPIREHAERTDQTTGGYANLGEARRTAVVGGLFNPLKALMEHPNYKKLDQKMKYDKQLNDWNNSLNSRGTIPQYNYNPTFATGGDYSGVPMKMYPMGGNVSIVNPYSTVEEEYKDDPKLKDLDYKDWLNAVETNSNKNYPNLIGKDELKDRARLYYYSQQLNQQLKSKNPKVYEDLQKNYGWKGGESVWDNSTNLANKTRVEGAEAYAKKHSDFYLSPDEQQKILKDSWDDYNKLRSKYGKQLDLIGENEDPNKPETWKVGARHSVAFNPSQYGTVVDTKNDKVAQQRGYKAKKFDYNVTYDPNREGDNKYITDINRFIKKLDQNDYQIYPYGGTTKLNPLDEIDFKKWYRKYSDEVGVNSNPDDVEHYYDYRGYWKDTGGAPVLKSNNYHLPDTYKLKGHPSYYRTDKESHKEGMYGKTESIYPYGGYHTNYGGNAELEDDEIFRTPNGDIEKVNGRSHAEGGENYNLPQNTEILGKNEAPNGKSYKENGDRLIRQFNKYTKILEDKPTALAKKTANLMLAKVHENYTNLMNQQEMEKYYMTPEEEMEYACGGIVPQFKGGGWIQKAAASIKRRGTKGKCTPITKPGCTGRARALALTFKKIARRRKHDDGGLINETGYLEGYSSDNNPMNIIPSNYITTNGMSRPISAMSDTGDYQNLYPNTGEYEFGGNYVMEQPLEYKSGGIYINPKNRGKFNALKKRTGKTTAQLTHSSNPLTRKRAIFAQNARKWKHDEGGLIKEGMAVSPDAFATSRNDLTSDFYPELGLDNYIPYYSPQSGWDKIRPRPNYREDVPERLIPRTGRVKQFQTGGDVYLNKQPNYRGFISNEDANTAKGFFGNDVNDIMETRQGAPRMLQPRGVGPSGLPNPIPGTTGMYQLSGTNQQYAPGQEHTRFVDETPDAWYNKAFDTVGQYAPMAYNLYQGLFGKPEHMNSQDYYNPYENQVMSLMRSRRYNVDPELEANRLAAANYYQNLRQGAPSQGRYLAGLQAGQISRQRGDAEAYARKQNMDNAYIGEEAQTLGGFGSQRAGMDFQVADINAANRAAQRRYLPTALSELQQQTQMNKIMREKKRLAMNQALTDEERNRLYMEAFKGYNFSKRINPITGEEN